MTDNYKKFVSVYENKYKTIKQHTAQKFFLSSDEADNMINEVFLSISKTLLKEGNENKHDFSTDKKILNYIYYCCASFCKTTFKNQAKIVYEEIDTIDEEIENEIEKKIFFDAVFNHLNKSNLLPIEISIFKYYLYFNIGQKKIAEQTGITYFTVNSSIKNCIEYLQTTPEIFTLYKDIFDI
jgi:RNA polymerase sigma factor (sigma-70 family)